MHAPYIVHDSIYCLKECVDSIKLPLSHCMENKLDTKKVKVPAVSSKLIYWRRELGVAGEIKRNIFNNPKGFVTFSANRYL